MQKQHYSIFINAPVQKVWDTMLTKETYEKWTTAFAEGSTFEGTWEEGSVMKFLGPDNSGGMIAEIASNKPLSFISIKHIGMISDGVIDTESDEVKKWTPAYENYTFTEKDAGTEVGIDIEMLEEFIQMFDEMWPKALQSLKEIAEQ